MRSSDQDSRAETRPTHPTFTLYNHENMSNETELTGATLLMYLMSRFNMTKQEALRSMRQAGHNTDNL
jgi:hypothetical protein